MSQETEILKYLKQGGQVSPKDALWLFNCFRLAARIHDLKMKGWDIRDAWITVNEHTRYKR